LATSPTSPRGSYEETGPSGIELNGESLSGVLCGMLCRRSWATPSTRYQWRAARAQAFTLCQKTSLKWSLRWWWPSSRVWWSSTTNSSSERLSLADNRWHTGLISSCSHSSVAHVCQWMWLIKIYWFSWQFMSNFTLRFYIQR